MKIHMKDEELELFTSFLVNGTNYLEFGMGGSTVLARKVVNGVVSSMDSNLDWVALVRNAIQTNGVNLDKVTNLEFADIGPVGDWGYPLDQSNVAVFNNYHEKFLQKISNLGEYNFVLIDGRFRVACSALASQKVSKDAVFAIHDYRSRDHYHEVENFLEPVEEVLDMTVFKIIPNTQKMAQEIFENYRYDVR